MQLSKQAAEKLAKEMVGKPVGINVEGFVKEDAGTITSAEVRDGYIVCTASITEDLSKIFKDGFNKRSDRLGFGLAANDQTYGFCNYRENPIEKEFRIEDCDGYFTDGEGI